MCIIGDVGSGKSSFLNSIIGDLLYMDPSLVEKHGGKLANEQLIDQLKKEIKDKRIINAPIKISEKIAYV